jgi:RNA-dependent RNA polymerase
MFAHDNIHLDVRPASATAAHVPDHCVFIRRCLITPLRVILLPPQLETSNALIRAHTPEECRDRLLRVHFVGEDAHLDIAKEIIETDNALNEIRGELARIRRALRSGIKVAGRHYQFLMFGESQIKYVST